MTTARVTTGPQPGLTARRPSVRTGARGPGRRPPCSAWSATGLGALLGGSPAALGAVIGFAMVLVFFATGAVVVNVVAVRQPRPPRCWSRC